MKKLIKKIGVALLIGATVLTTINIPVANHTVFAATQKTSAGYLYEKFSDHVEIVGYESPSEDIIDLKIPSKIANLPVTTICCAAFAECQTIKSVTIPTSVTVLEPDIFRGCDVLETVSFPGTIETIPGGTFNGCDVLKTVKLAEGIKTICSRAFYDCERLESIELPASITEFYGNSI